MYERVTITTVQRLQSSMPLDSTRLIAALHPQQALDAELVTPWQVEKGHQQGRSMSA